MSYQKNLGRVRGKKGGYYRVSNIEPYDKINNVTNKYKFILQYDDNEDETIGTNNDNLNFTIPIIYPTIVDDEDEKTTKIKFNITNNLSDVGGELFNSSGVDIKGPPGEVKLRTYHVPSEYSNIESAAENDPNFEKSEDMIYIIGGDIKKIYIWHKRSEYDEVGEFDSLDGVNLENYYTKNETYSKTQIDQFIDDINYYDKLSLGILDVNYNTSGSDFIEQSSIPTTVEEEIRALLSDYAKKEDLYFEVVETENERQIIIHGSKGIENPIGE